MRRWLPSLGWLVLALGLVLCRPDAVSAQCAGVSFRTTHVDPALSDCSGTAVWFGNGNGGGVGIVVNTTLDGDGNFGTLPGMDETMDKDAVFGTIQDAVDCTLPGGTVLLSVPGTYRESVEIMQSITIKALDGINVILENDMSGCATSGSPTAAGFDLVARTGAPDVVVQNVTFRGWNRGIGNTGDAVFASLTVENCRFDDNEFGIRLTGEAFNSLRVAGSRFVNNETAGIFAAPTRILVNGPSVTIEDTYVGMNAGPGVDVECIDCTINVAGSAFVSNREPGSSAGLHVEGGGIRANLSDSRFSFNMGHGVEVLSMSSMATQRTVVRATGCTMSGNTEDGLRASQQTGGSVQADLVLVDNRIFSNDSDGVQLETDGVDSIAVSLRDNAIAHNLAFSLNYGVNTMVQSCNPGRNLLAGMTFNPLTPGGESAGGGANCASLPVPAVHSNQMP